MIDLVRSRKLEQARALIRASSWTGATAVLRDVLSLDPDDADAHLMLASVLHAQRRIHAALHEAELGIALAPESAVAHRVLGTVLLGHRRLDDAERHLGAALDLAPDDPDAHCAMADLALARGRRDEAYAALEHALTLAPEDPETLAELALLAIDRGHIDDAERFAREALDAHPGATRALVAMGRVLLARGDVAGAREHAIWALRNDATAPSALHLMSAIKARESAWLGLWWRWATFTTQLGEARAVALVIGTFVAYRVLTLVLEDLEMSGAASLVQIVWVAVCAYTWIGPSAFRRMLERELDDVTIRDDY